MSLIIAALQCTLFAGQIWSASLDICSFNIQFLGNSKARDNKALARLLKDFDVVVVQELVAPPYAGMFPDGTAFKPDREAAKFFDEMMRHGFSFWLSEEDTGTGDTIHLNGSSTEWWVTFFKTNRVSVAKDLPWGFLADDRSNHLDYERVPYAFAFRTLDQKLDFVLISVHLMPGAASTAKARRKTELEAIFSWIAGRTGMEKDFIVLGDMNIENARELSTVLPQNYRSLNESCIDTNTNLNQPKPYDHVMYSSIFTQNELDSQHGFKVINLIKEMRVPWKKRFATKYPGDPPYNHTQFRLHYSDHHPVCFRAVIPNTDDD